MGVFADITHLFEMGYGWLLLALLLAWQLLAPKYLGADTALSPLVRDMPEQVENIDEKQDEIRQDVDHVQDHVQEVQERQKVSMQVQRAQARANDQMDHEQVDAYLLQNGVEPSAFLHGDPIGGYENWESENSDMDNLTDDGESDNGGRS